MIEIVNKPYSYTFKNYASKNKKILCLSGDLTSSCEVDQFRDEFPNQFVSMGMAEQNMMSFAGGLSMSGYIPFIHTFGVFTYRRPYDQLLASIAYPRRKIRIMGFLPGINQQIAWVNPKYAKLFRLSSYMFFIIGSERLFFMALRV